MSYQKENMVHMEIADAGDGPQRQTRWSRKSLVFGLGILAIGALVVVAINRQEDIGAKMMRITAENDATCGTKNVALRKPAFQISNYGSIYLAPTAVDGNTNQNLIRGRSCSHTAHSLNPWLAVDLGKSSQVCSVRIYNRGDCCGNRLTNFKVFVSNRKPVVGKQFNIQASEVCASYKGGAFSVKSLTCTRNVKGRYVGVEINGRQYLSICELQVFAKKAPVAKVSATQAKFANGAPVTIKYSGAVSQFSWIGVYAKSETDMQVIKEFAFVTTVPQGTVTLKGLAAGNYKAYLFPKEGYKPIAGPSFFSVAKCKKAKMTFSGLGGACGTTTAQCKSGLTCMNKKCMKYQTKLGGACNAMVKCVPSPLVKCVKGKCAAATPKPKPKGFTGWKIVFKCHANRMTQVTPMTTLRKLLPRAQKLQIRFAIPGQMSNQAYTVTSRLTPRGYPNVISNFKKMKTLNALVDGGRRRGWGNFHADNFVGSGTALSRFWFSCAGPYQNSYVNRGSQYRVAYWACNNGRGVHVVKDACNWFAAPGNSRTKDLALYFRYYQ